MPLHDRTLPTAYRLPHEACACVHQVFARTAATCLLLCCWRCSAAAKLEQRRDAHTHKEGQLLSRAGCRLRHRRRATLPTRPADMSQSFCLDSG